MAALVLLVVADKTGTAMFFFKHRVVVGIFVLMALMGYLNLKTTVRQETMADKISTEYRCSMVCKVDDIRESGYGYQVYVTGTQAGGHNVKVKIILYMNEVVDVRIGLQLISEGKFTRPEEATNPGTFDARSYYAHKGIYLVCKDPVIVGRGEKYSVIKDFLYRFRLKAGCVLDRYFDEQDASVMRGMLLGEKSGIDKDTKRLFQVNGIAHILAISGVHIAIIGMTLYKMLRRISGSNILSGILSVGVVVLYGMMTGLASSTLRAVIMMAIVVTAKAVGRSPDMLTSAGIACVIQAVMSPQIVMDAGFQMSFAAVLGIAIINPLLVKAFSCAPKSLGRNTRKTDKKTGDKRHRFSIEKIASTFLLNVAVTMATTPLIIYYYYQFPLYSIILNMIIVPLVSVLLLCCIVVAFAGMMSGVAFVDMAAGWLSVPVKGILWSYRWLCELVCRIPGYNVNTGYITLRMMIAIYVTVVFALWLLARRAEDGSVKHDWQAATLLNKLFCSHRRNIVLACAIILIGGGYVYVSCDRDFRAVYMDVGQGDGILIRTGGGTNILIDGGSSDNSQVGEYVISPVLRYYGAAHIDYAFVTHSDKDHVSGLLYLLETENTGVRIDNVVLPMYGVQEELEEIKQAAEKSGINVIYMKKGDAIVADRSGVLSNNGRDTAKISLSFLYPGPEIGINDINELSAVIRLDYLSYKMLFTGDIGETGEKYLLGEGADIKADVLKVGHHGSRYSSCDEFLDSVSPKVAVISAGEGNSYGHPHQETVERLKAHGADVSCTIECGAVSVIIDRGGLKKEQYR